MFSKELQQLDQNTVQLMIDDMQNTIDNQAEEMQNMQEQHKTEIAEKEAEIAKKDAEIAESAIQQSRDTAYNLFKNGAKYSVVRNSIANLSEKELEAIYQKATGKPCLE